MKSKILLVEDEQSQRMLYKQVLSEDGYTVFDAKDGVQALNIVRLHSPDLAILDIRLSGEDGLDLMGQLLQINNNMPVILHSAYSAWKDNFRGKMADAYIIKSSDLTELRNAVNKFLPLHAN
ncbi:MAG: response regulator [Deferribacteres bacterium]|nr:response regulator [candidate division KSB1 bacterium]MCB9501497.1 response regulator [Deferribacteres bacterium]